MKKISRLPHEQVSPDENDGLPANDVEGHGLSQLVPGMPGTGGDRVREASGDELLRQVTGDEPEAGKDVEGHAMGHTKGERIGPGMPGTGGDARPDDGEGPVSNR
ncbi:MAG: hypothetical protein ACJ761_07625 [Chloroflexota bacterium]